MATLDVHETGVDELLHVVGEQRLRDAEQRDQLALAHLLLAAAQHVEDLDSQRLGQRLRRRRDPLGVKRGSRPADGAQHSAAAGPAGTVGRETFISTFVCSTRITLARTPGHIDIY